MYSIWHIYRFEKYVNNWINNFSNSSRYVLRACSLLLNYHELRRRTYYHSPYHFFKSINNCCVALHDDSYFSLNICVIPGNSFIACRSVTPKFSSIAYWSIFYRINNWLICWFSLGTLFAPLSLSRNIIDLTFHYLFTRLLWWLTINIALILAVTRKWSEFMSALSRFLHQIMGKCVYHLLSIRKWLIWL